MERGGTSGDGEGTTEGGVVTELISPPGRGETPLDRWLFRAAIRDRRLHPPTKGSPESGRGSRPPISGVAGEPVPRGPKPAAAVPSLSGRRSPRPLPIAGSPQPVPARTRWLQRDGRSRRPQAVR